MEFCLRLAITFCLLRKTSPCFPYFPTFSTDPKRRDDRRHVFPISPHSVLNLYKRKIFALVPYFPTFSAEPKHRENVCSFPVFPYI